MTGKEPLDNKYPRVNFRMGGSLQADLLVRGDSPDAVAKRDLERYYYGLRYSFLKLNLTLDEVVCLIDIFNGTIFRPETIMLLWASVDDAIDEIKIKYPQINGRALVARLRGLSYIDLLSIADAIERFWGGEENHIEDTVERIYALKLVQRETI